MFWARKVLPYLRVFLVRECPLSPILIYDELTTVQTAYRLLVSHDSGKDFETSPLTDR